MFSGAGWSGVPATCSGAVVVGLKVGVVAGCGLSLARLSGVLLVVVLIQHVVGKTPRIATRQ